MDRRYTGPGSRTPVKLVPRLKGQGYTDQDLAARRQWLEKETGARLTTIGACAIPGESMRGNIENPIGSVQTPLGVVGPILVRGEHAQGVFYAPMATTEGALLRSYERGMVALTRAGGVTVRVHQDENQISPVFFLDDVAEAHDFSVWVQSQFESIRVEAESTTNHGKLLRLERRTIGREVIVTFCYATGDAQGMNMIAKATERACRWIIQHGTARKYHIFSGLSSEKRASAHLLSGGKGKKVTAGVLLPATLAKAFFRATPREIQAVWHHSMLGHVQAQAVGFNAHYANGLAAIFIACGQDVANVANASVGITNLDLTEEGDLYASATLSSLTVATVGGGVALGTARECLEIMDCFGDGKARKFAEIIAATLLAGELSFSAAIATGEFVSAHENYGRNRPEK